jgi:proline iminopeptidase
MSSLLRRITGVLLLVLTPVVATVAGLAAFLAAATLTARLPLLSACGVVIMALTAVVVGAAGWRLLRHRERTVGFAVLVTLACASLAGMSVLVPGARPAAGPAPAWVRFWTLPTGSHLAYAYLPATGPKRPYPVVFLHGGPGTPGNGLPAVAGSVAAAGFDVYSYDQVGAGRSSRLDDVTGYTVARQVADLEAIRRTLGADRIILVGQSWGGSLTAQYLAAHGEHVAKAVFTSPGALWGRQYPGSKAGEPWNRLSPAQKARLDRLNSAPRIIAASLLLQINPGAAHALVGDREVDHWMHEVALQGKDSTSCEDAPPTTAHDNPQGFYSNQMTVRDFEQLPDPRPRLRTLRVPSLIMRGECDFIKPAVTAEYQHALAGSELVTVKGAGHSISGEQPGRYTVLLRAFLLDEPLPTGTG